MAENEDVRLICQLHRDYAATGLLPCLRSDAHKSCKFYGATEVPGSGQPLHNHKSSATVHDKPHNTYLVLVHHGSWRDL